MDTLLRYSSLLIAEDSTELARMAALLVMTSARKSLQTRERFDFVLSGGRTPRILYECLVRLHRRSIDWKKVRFFWGDERNVPPDHPESNFRMAKESLLDPLKIAPEQIFRIQTELASPELAASQYEKTLRGLFHEKPHFDVVLLGMGDDGHTASLFPDAWTEWSDAEKSGHWVWAPWVPHLGDRRVTMLPEVVSSATKVIFLVSGATKAKILRDVLEHDPKKPVNYPSQLIGAIRERRGEEHPLWLADTDASSDVRQVA
jgi:6-phosphogluconolactonase